MSDPLHPSAVLLARIGSVVVHVDEMLSETDPRAAEFDREAIRGLLADDEVLAWLAEMLAMCLLPEKRK